MSHGGHFQFWQHSHTILTYPQIVLAACDTIGTAQAATATLEAGRQLNMVLLFCHLFLMQALHEEAQDPAAGVTQ
jgi:hypothetical protein